MQFCDREEVCFTFNTNQTQPSDETGHETVPSSWSLKNQSL